MPYKRIGRTIYHYKNNKWQKKQECISIKNAKAALRLLESIENRLVVLDTPQVIVLLKLEPAESD